MGCVRARRPLSLSHMNGNMKRMDLFTLDFHAELRSNLLQTKEMLYCASVPLRDEKTVREHVYIIH